MRAEAGRPGYRCKCGHSTHVHKREGVYGSDKPRRCQVAGCKCQAFREAESIARVAR